MCCGLESTLEYMQLQRRNLWRFFFLNFHFGFQFLFRFPGRRENVGNSSHNASLCYRLNYHTYFFIRERGDDNDIIMCFRKFHFRDSSRIRRQKNWNWRQKNANMMHPNAFSISHWLMDWRPDNWWTIQLQDHTLLLVVHAFCIWLHCGCGLRNGEHLCHFSNSHFVFFSWIYSVCYRCTPFSSSINSLLTPKFTFLSHHLIGSFCHSTMRTST